MTTTTHFGLEDLFGTTIVGAGTEATIMSAAQLSIFRGEPEAESREPEPIGPSLEDVWPEFEKFKLARRIAKSTLVNYRTALNRLAEWSNLRFNTPEVPAATLTRPRLRDFQSWIADDDTRHKKARANRHLDLLKAMWDWAEEEEFLPTPPKFPRRFDVRSKPDKTTLSDEQLVKIFDACDAAKWPTNHGLPPATYWRCLLQFMSIYGIDVQTLVPYDADKVGKALKLNAFTFTTLSPCDFMDVHNEYGWFSLARPKTERKKPLPAYYPLNAVTRAIVDRLWPPLLDRCDPPAVRLFPFPLCNKKLRDTWSDIVAAADVSPRHGGKFLMIHFRNTAANRYSSDVANYLLGHSSRGYNAITEQHYRTALPKVVEEVNAAALAECFR